MDIMQGNAAPGASNLHQIGADMPVLSHCSLYIDAGISNIHLRALDSKQTLLLNSVVPSNTDIQNLLSSKLTDCDFGAHEQARIYITGKLASTVKQNLGRGKVILPAAAYWLTAQELINVPANEHIKTLALINLSASGYMLIGVNRSGNLEHNLLTVNPRCGAGSGVNLDRVLQKLAIERDQVDELLSDFLGEAGSEKRRQILIRTDRCGVFASSATISDKNQGIPLDIALATTLKSEVSKACTRLPQGFDKVYLSGRIFMWQFARECAEDILLEAGVSEIDYDIENEGVLDSMRKLAEKIGNENIAQPDTRLLHSNPVTEFPAFKTIRSRYEQDDHFLRLQDTSADSTDTGLRTGEPVIMALDVGSTMAKAVIASAKSGKTLLQYTCSNAGDTIETIKKIFSEIIACGHDQLVINSIGVTGSARYQVQQALQNIFPEISQRISLLVENYAHARGSIDHARSHIDYLKQQGHHGINEDFCILIDIGGEDTKISTIALNEAELFDNAMNLKCSAGTGSLMDTLSTMFNIDTVSEACARAYKAERSFSINATCAVFLMENASRLQAQGVPQAEILASANWAIVENMARTLWSQLELPSHCVVLLHGQTMLSQPLPLAVTHRLHEYLEAPIYALVPPSPGHRACYGLVQTLMQESHAGDETISLQKFTDTNFDKRIILCKGAACGDASARCNRCSLSCHSNAGKRVSFTLGGCTAINELLGRKSNGKAARPSRDAYREIWEFIDSHHPRTDNPDRLVIPRSFAVSEWAYFLSRIFDQLGIPVHVDNVSNNDIIDAQPTFSVDSCAPHIGAVGQFNRLASEPHGIILAAQIEQLPTGGISRGITCTTNQGGVATAGNLAVTHHPQACLHYLHLKLDELDADYLCDQLYPELTAVFEHYGLSPELPELRACVQTALDDHLQLRRDAADLATELAEEALEEGRQVALIVGREYILNPGIYDSHIQRLLHDKHMAAIPSYVIDIELDEEYRHIYWRNPHFIVSLLNAVSHKNLHQRVHHPGLADIFRRIEQSPDSTLLPVVQVSTFSCGPDSVTAHYIADIMRQRPFLMIQSDAAIKELAHLENRVNTYITQLEQRLHEKLKLDSDGPASLRTLDSLSSREPLNKETDVIFFPTLSDNRVVTSVLRGAGYTCLENYDDNSYDLHQLVTEGRKVTGDAVCAPLAGMYADLARGVEEFVRRKKANDPAFIGKKRLLYFDSQGSGPCRQGQYPHVHKLLYHSSVSKKSDGASGDACNALFGNSIFQLLVTREDKGYDPGLEEWVLIRAYQGIILQGVLHDLLFRGASACHDFDQYQTFIEDYQRLKSEIFRLLACSNEPGKAGHGILKLVDKVSWLSLPAKYFLYRMHGREFRRPLRQFARKWRAPSSSSDRLKVLVSGEGYMRVSQSEDIFDIVLSQLGFDRFELRVTPLMTYLEYLFDEAELHAESEVSALETRVKRTSGEDRKQASNELKRKNKLIRNIGIMRFLLRRLLASPLYSAACEPMPMSSRQMMESSRKLLPTRYPAGELAPYLGEAIDELRHGIDVLLNVGPNGCMVSSMAQVMTPSIMQANASTSGRIQNLFSADGDVNEDQLTLALLTAMGPVRYYQRSQ